MSSLTQGKAPSASAGGGAVSQEFADQLDTRLRAIEQKLDRIAVAGVASRRASVSDVPSKQPTPKGSGRAVGFNMSGSTTVSPQEEALTPEPPSGGKARVAVVAPRMSITDGSPARRMIQATNKKDVATTRKKRDELFGPLFVNVAWNDIKKMAGVKCGWLCAIALAIQYVSGKTTTIDQIMQANSLALHYLAIPSVTLAEVFDITSEYLETNEEMKKANLRIETATFERECYDDIIEESTGTGDRPPIVSLAALRKELTMEQANPKSLYIFNFDPYVVQEAEALQDALEDDENEEGSPASESIQAKQWQPKNVGSFALLTAYNSALHAVTLAVPHLGPDNKFQLEKHTCSLNTLYEATARKDGYSKRCRGFVRIYVAEEDEEVAVTSLYPITTLDGRNANGQISIALDPNIAPHLLGLGLVHHLVQSTFSAPAALSRRNSAMAPKVKKVELCGIMVSHICEVLHLPLSAVVASSTRDSLPLAVAWYQQYLESTRQRSSLNIGYVPISRRDDTEDGALNVSEEEFFETISSLISDKAIVMIGFDVNIAQNTPHMPPDASAHFAVVVGVDEHRGLVKLADVNVKKYRKVWHIPFFRLFNATIGYGFMVVSPTEEHANRLAGVEKAKALLDLAKYQLPPRISNDPSSVLFEYPHTPYSITVLASALTRLGYTTRVEDLLYGSGFHISFLLSGHIPMLDAARILSYHSHTALDDEVAVLATVLDTPDAFTLEAYRALLKGVTSSEKERSNTQIVVFFDALSIQKNPAVWNGSYGGNKAVVVGYDVKTEMVTLMDSNPNSFYRQWRCPVDVLYSASMVKDRIPDRARGFLRVCKQKNEESNTTKKVDMRVTMVHHPFKPVISAPAASIALAFSEIFGSPFSQEDVIYSNSKFSLAELTTEVNADMVVDMANRFIDVKKFKASVKKLCSGPCDTKLFKESLESDKVCDVLIYNIKTLFGETLASSGGAIGAALVVQVANDTLTLADGNPTRFGASWNVSSSKVMPSIIGVVRIESTPEKK